MKLVPCDKKELGFLYKRTKNLIILEEFANSEYDCVRVMFDNSGAKNAVNSLNSSINRFRMNGIKAIKRKDKVYLVKDF